MGIHCVWWDIYSTTWYRVLSEKGWYTVPPISGMLMGTAAMRKLSLAKRKPNALNASPTFFWIQIALIFDASLLLHLYGLSMSILFPSGQALLFGLLNPEIRQSSPDDCAGSAWRAQTSRLGEPKKSETTSYHKWTIIPVLSLILLWVWWLSPILLLSVFQHIHIYIERERGRGREREREMCVYVYIYVYMCV